MTEEFRFSPHAHRADEIDWRTWGPAAFDDAERADKLVLLNLSAVWCHGCREMDETTYSDPELIELIDEQLIPIRVDADRQPHIRDRYISGGWPTNALLAPSGGVLWAGTQVDPREFRRTARRVLRAWDRRRDDLEAEMERRRKGLESARGQRDATGLVRREAADDVLTAAQSSFDPRNGGFDAAPKFPQSEAVEMLFIRGIRTKNPDWLAMAERTLDGMRAGELWDEDGGGFFRYATEPDWTEPRREKLLETNAGLLRIYARGAARGGREDWRETAEQTVAWADRALGRPDGLWAASEFADPEYYAPNGPEGEHRREPPRTDPTLYTDANARWIRALIDAGTHLERGDWIERGEDALEMLLDTMAAPEDVLYHYRAPDADPALAGLLGDAVEAARACLRAADATGRDEPLARARRLTGGIKRSLWAENGGLFDYPPAAGNVGRLRFPDRPFEENAAAARLLVGLWRETDERSYRAMAERVLALLSPLAGRYGVAAAEFALAAEDFFEYRTAS